MQRKFKIRILAFIFMLVMVITSATNIFAINVNEAKLPNAQIKNIIVMIPDGMSIDGVALSRWYKSYDAKTGNIDTSVTLAMDELASGLVRTYWSDGKTIGAIVDSAPAATAMASGIKTFDKFVGMTPESTPVATIIEAAQLIGKSTGIVVTCNVQHATPAAYTSHYNDRSRYDIIGEQQAYNGLDVVLGGGSMYLGLPYRKDNENIINEIKMLDYNYVTTRNEMNEVTEGKLWGMFADDAMAYDFDRAENAADEPSLAEMTAKAIELLSQNENGFFLMVEGSKVDWTAHANDPIGLISDILAFDEAVKVALDYAKANQDTMLLIMTDHGNGGITIGNYDTDASYSKDPVGKFIAPLKKAKLTGEGVAFKFGADRINALNAMKALNDIDDDADEEEKLTAAEIKEITAKFKEERAIIVKAMKDYYGMDDLTEEEITAIMATPNGSMNYTVGPMISKRAYLGWTTTGHTGEEVNLYTYLPDDLCITGTIDNTDIAKICAGVWEISLSAVTKLLYNDAETAFKAKGAFVEIDVEIPSSGRMTVTKGAAVLVILENKNYVILDDDIYIIDSVIVNQSGKFYVPQIVLDMIP
ncbi:MAG: alkaline phosphatase [Oscillospiraceae bacterium]|nr:alkaline phosphatase [Oscillospiraceae bacterium]